MKKKRKGTNTTNSEDQAQLFTDAINSITAKLCDDLLKEFAKLPEEIQKGLVLIKSSQLMLANILCHLALNKEELEELINSQGQEMRELTWDCAMTGFANKFGLVNH